MENIEDKVQAFKRDLEQLMIEHEMVFVPGSWGNPTRIEKLDGNVIDRLKSARLKYFD